MPKLINRLLLCALCSVFLSCARSTFVDDKEVVVTRLVDVALKIDFDDNAPRGVASKSGWLGSQVLPMGGGATKANALERRVNDINVFFVRERHEATQDAGLVRHIFLDEIDLVRNDTVVLKNVYLGKYIMYMVANVGDLSQGGMVAYTAEMIRDFAFNMNGISDAGNGWAMRGLPMFSREVVEIKFEGDGVKPISGRLHFGVAKVKFNCNIDPAMSSRNNIYISSVALVNTASNFMPFGVSRPTIEASNALYAKNYIKSENRQSLDTMFYVYPNMADSVASITSAEDRTIAKSPADATYIYIQTTYTNASNNTEIYGFYVYLGDQNVMSNFYTRASNQYDVTVNIKGIDPDNDPRISSFSISKGVWKEPLKVDSWSTIDLTIKAQNLRNQSLFFMALAKPPRDANLPNSCRLNLRDVDRTTVLFGPVNHPVPLQTYPDVLTVVDKDKYEVVYVLGFMPYKKSSMSGYSIEVTIEDMAGVRSTVDIDNMVISD